MGQQLNPIRPAARAALVSLFAVLLVVASCGGGDHQQPGPGESTTVPATAGVSSSTVVPSDEGPTPNLGTRCLSLPGHDADGQPIISVTNIETSESIYQGPSPVPDEVLRECGVGP